MKLKITGGELRGRWIKTPKGATTRPTSERLRQTLFDIIAHYVEGAHFLDAYAGSGAMGIESLSRGAKYATFVEQDKTANSIIDDNLKTVNLTSKATLFKCDCKKGLGAVAQKHKVDIAYFDPPYPKNEEELNQLNFIFEVLNAKDIMNKNGLIFLELSIQSDELDISGYPNIQHVKTRNVGSSQLVQYLYIG